MKKLKIINNLKNDSICLDDSPVHLRINNTFTKRQEFLDGRPHTVVGATMLIGDSVLCGHAGCFFYTNGAIARSLISWNGKPVTNRHPEKDGTPVSVNASTDIYNQYVIGKIFNASFVNNKLTAELWLDDSKSKDILAKLNAGYSIDVSTGMFTEEIPNFNGNAVQGSITEIYPDHLSLLPNERGACDLEMGCGVMAGEGAPKRFPTGFNDYSGQRPVFNHGEPEPLPDSDSFEWGNDNDSGRDNDNNTDVPALPNCDFDD